MHTRTTQIWLLIDSSQIGGIETHILQLAKGLQDHAQSVQVFFIRCYPNHPIYNLLEQKKIQYSFLDKSPLSLIQSIMQQRPAIIHTHGYKAGILGRLSSFVTNTPCVSTFHAGEKPTGKVRLYDWIDRASAGLSSQSLAVSELVSARLYTRNQIMNNFVDITQAKPSCGREIAFVGRLSQEKGPDTFLDIARNLNTLDFDVYGDGPMADTLKNESPKNVTFHGFQPDMDSVWSSISLLIISSQYEGLPMAALEAMARGIPVISFDVGALHTVIDHGRNGWLATSSNHLELSHYISLWLDTCEEEKQAMRLRAIQKIQDNFSQQIMIPKYINIYKNISKSNPIASSNTTRISSHD